MLDGVGAKCALDQELASPNNYCHLAVNGKEVRVGTEYPDAFVITPSHEVHVAQVTDILAPVAFSHAGCTCGLRIKTTKDNATRLRVAPISKANR
jgi:hypothetical protein